MRDQDAKEPFTTLGQQLRGHRSAARWRQADLGDAIRASQSLISRMECGSGANVPLATWAAAADALDADLSCDLLPRHPPDGAVEDPRLRMARVVTRIATKGGWAIDQRTILASHGGLQDLALSIRDPGRDRLVVVRCWDIVPSTTAVLEDLDQVLRLHTRDTPPADVRGLVIIRRSTSNRRRITEGAAAFDRRFVETGSRWTGCLARRPPQRLPPDAMLWVDRDITRLIPTRLFLDRPRNPRSKRSAA